MAGSRERSAPHDRLGRVTDRLDRHVGVEDADNAARAGFQALVAPGERADQTALAQHQLDVAAEIFRVQQTFLERPAVEGEHVLAHAAAGFLVGVFERAEEFRRRLAVLLGELVGEIGPHTADRGVHGVVAGAGVHAPPPDLALEHPMQRVEIGAGVIAEVFHQILLRLALVMFVPAGVQDEDVAFADVGAAALDHFGRDHRPVVHVFRNVDHHAAVAEIIERQRGHVALAVVGGMHGAIEMSTDVHGGVDALRHDHLGLQILRVIHLVAGVTDPAGGMHVHDMGEIDDFH